MAGAAPHRRVMSVVENDHVVDSRVLQGRGAGRGDGNGLVTASRYQIATSVGKPDILALGCFKLQNLKSVNPNDARTFSLTATSMCRPGE